MIFARLRPSVFIPAGILMLLLGGAAAILALTGRAPEVTSIEPTAVSSGDTISIGGRHFGDDRNGAYVSVAGRRLTSSSYIRWTDTEIAVRIPEFSRSGLVEVHTDRGGSDGILLRHSEEVPIAASEQPLQPEVEEIEPEDPAVGEVITIRGQNLGEHRNRRVIEFSGVDGQPVVPEDDRTAYEHWSSREIRVRVPSGADSGTLRIIHGDSVREIGEINVRRVGGELSVGAGRESIIERNVRVRGISPATEDDAAIHFWLPAPQDRVHQRPPEVLSHNGPEPLAVDDGMYLYEWNATERTSAGLRWNELYVRNAISADISADSVRTGYDRESGVYRRYVAAREGLPVETEELQFYAEPAASSNPLRVVENVWSWMRENVVFDEDSSDDVLEVLDSGSGNAAGIADAFVSMLRANGVPARPVRGLLVTQDGELPFYSWVEFYLHGFGWVPADPARGIGAGSYYFEDTEPAVTLEPEIGELDNRVIAFGAGVPRTPSLHPEGNSVRVTGVYAPRAIAYESRGAELESLQWRNPVLLGSREVTAAPKD